MHVCLYGLAALMLLPIVILVFTSLKTDIEVYDGVLKLPSEFQWVNYIKVWNDAGFGTYMKNSAIVSTGTVVLVVILASLAGFGFAKLRFRGQNFTFLLLLLGLMVPVPAIIIPLYFNLRDMRLLNTPWGLILPQVGLGLPFGTFLMRQFFRDIPDELMDAAMIDGCGELGAFRHVFLPNARKGLESLAVVQFMFSWNEYFLPLIISQNDAAQTVTVGLYRLYKSYVASHTTISAGAVMVFLPILLMYILLQRRFMGGMLGGSLKG